MKPEAEVLEYWRRMLGEVPDADRLGQVDSLNEISDAVVMAARSLGATNKAEDLIASYLRPERRHSIGAFVRDVVRGQTDAANWKRGRFVVPDWSFAEQVTLPRDRLLQPVGMHVTLRVVPELSAWTDGTSWVGAPCLAEPSADYLTPVPERGAGLWKGARTELVADIAVTVRRWIAARIAAAARSKVGADFTRAAEATEQYAPLREWTPDANAALKALVRETQQFGKNLESPPGFRGPDDWFRD